MTALPVVDLQQPTFEDCIRLHALLEKTGLERAGSPDLLLTAKSRAEIALTSLDVIVLMVKYMENLGLDPSEFSPDWVELLETVSGIIHVMKLIEELANDG